MSSDEIDIEEHDVLDNPRISYQDGPLIKTEPADHFDEEYENEDFGGDYSDGTNNFQDNGVEFDTCEEEQYYPQYGNKIILGSKPNSNAELITNGYEYDSNQRDTAFEINLENVNLQPRLILTDWGGLLKRSACYCRICKTLFPTNNAFDAHNMIAHSLLVPLDESNTYSDEDFKNTARKSTSIKNKECSNDRKGFQCELCPTVIRHIWNLRRHYRNKHDILTTTQVLANSVICKHCKKFFSDQNAIVNHLYEEIRIIQGAHTKDHYSRPIKQEASCSKIKIKNIKKEFDADQKIVGKVDKVKRVKGRVDMCYVCDICSCSFKNDYFLERHTTKNHNMKIKDPKPVPFNGKCPYCPYHKIDRYNEHIDLSHPDLYRKVQLVTRPKFNCSECSLVFSNDVALKTHIADVHKRKTIKSTYIIGKKKPILKVGLSNNENTPIPKKVLFSCNKCLVNFLSCGSLLHHSLSCKMKIGAKDIWICPRCNHIFKVASKKAHELQHKTTDVFHIYEQHHLYYDKVLCECPKCDLCVSNVLFKRHFEVCDGSGQGTVCKICKFRIHPSTMPRHLKRHREIGETKNYFMKIEYLKPDKPISNKDICLDKVSRKRKLNEKIDEVPAKIPKLLGLYYCSTCKACMSNLPSTRSCRPNIHRTGACKDITTKVCKLCGLYFTIKTLQKHMRVHKNNKFTSKDITIIRIADLKIVNLVPDYFTCKKKCGVQFWSKQDRSAHICNDIDYSTCEVCFKKYSADTFRLHSMFHEQSTSIPQNDMTHLLSRYNSLKPLWNILYTCDDCQLTTDSYDRVVEHCQRHLVELNGADIQEALGCKTCDLIFDNESFERHKQLHIENNVNKQSFKIMFYTYSNLFSDDWLELFKSLTKEQTQQILFRSKYNLQRSIKMELIIDGLPEFTLYRCLNCNSCVSPAKLNNHCCIPKYDGKNRKRIKRHRCPLCNIWFDSYKSRSTHNIFHKSGNNNPPYRILGFYSFPLVSLNKSQLPKQHESEKNNTNPKIPVPIKTKKKLNCKKVSHSGKLILKISLKNKMIMNSITEREIFIYRCLTCNICYYNKTEALAHVRKCNGERTGTKCNECDKLFISADTHKHSEEKKETIVSLKNYKNNVFMVYKCDPCDLYFITHNSLKSHKHKNHVLRLKTLSCKYCKLKFTFASLKLHLALHHKNCAKVKLPKSIYNVTKKLRTEEQKCKANDEDKNEPEVYKCKTCSLHFTDKRHFGLSSKCGKAESLVCGSCRLRFELNSLMEHRSAGCSNSYKVKTLKCIRYHRTIYKCEKCTLHFLTKSSLKKHKSDGHVIGSERIKKCAKCHLRFTTRALRNHISYHHNELQLRREDMVIRDLVDVLAAENSKIEHTNEDSYVSIDDNELDTTNESLETSINNGESSSKITLYKCAPCDVLFLSQSACYKHVTKHKPLDSADYHECKYCHFQFKNSNLLRHIKYHHKENMSLKDVFIEEYTPSHEIRKGPKIETYSALDRVQSKLVSTTTGDQDWSLSHN